MSLLSVPPNPFCEFVQRSPGGDTLREYRPMNILGRVSPCTADNDGLAFIVPLENGAWADSQFSSDFNGY